MVKTDQLAMFAAIIWTIGVLYWASSLTDAMNRDGQNLIVEATPQPTEEKIIQKLPPPKVRFTVEQEIEMACAEVDCVKKCQTQYYEKKEKFDVCKKQCAKDRCKERCKKEPNLSYVERELKKDKCLDKCKTTDATCKNRCEEETKRCKDRCKERAKKYFCVRDLDKLGQEEENEEIVVNPQVFEDESIPNVH